jgi:hypothetical protein
MHRSEVCSTEPDVALFPINNVMPVHCSWRICSGCCACTRVMGRRTWPNNSAVEKLRGRLSLIYAMCGGYLLVWTRTGIEIGLCVVVSCPRTAYVVWASTRSEGNKLPVSRGCLWQNLVISTSPPCDKCRLDSFRTLASSEVDLMYSENIPKIFSRIRGLRD